MDSTTTGQSPLDDKLVDAARMMLQVLLDSDWNISQALVVPLMYFPAREVTRASMTLEDVVPSPALLDEARKLADELMHIGSAGR